MNPFFSYREHQTKLLNAAKSWEKTPFVERQGIKQAGVDCVHLIHALIAVECGFPHEFKPPFYNMDETMHQERSPLVEYLDNSEGLVRGKTDEILLMGDILIFQIGKGPHHGGVMLNEPKFIHALRGLGTTISQLDDSTYAKRFRGFYRPMIKQ